jgi:hypothetical protein
LLQPIIGMAEDPATGGYWLVAANGGVFAFHASYFPNPGGLSGVVDSAPTVSGNGYWLVTSAGAVHNYGAAGNFGLVAAPKSPVAGIVSAAGSTGYDVAASNGAVYAFGGAIFLGDMAKVHLNAPIIDIATPQP